MTVCLVYEVSLATRRAHASSLIVAAAYVRFIRSTERMTTTYTKLSARPSQVGDSGPMEWTSPHSLPRENLSLARPRPSRATPSALRASCEENVSLPSHYSLGNAGSSPKETNRARAKSSIEDVRPTQMPNSPLPTNPRILHPCCIPPRGLRRAVTNAETLGSESRHKVRLVN